MVKRSAARHGGKFSRKGIVVQPVAISRKCNYGFANPWHATQWNQRSHRTNYATTLAGRSPWGYQAGVFSALRICRAKADTQSSPPAGSAPKKSSVAPSTNPVRKSSIQRCLFDAGLWITDADINGSDEWYGY